MQPLRALVALVVDGNVRGREARDEAAVLLALLLRGGQHHPDVYAAL